MTGSEATHTIYCYSVHRMTKKKLTLDKAVKRTAEILLTHFRSLPPEEAKATREEIHALAVRSSLSANRVKSSRPVR